MTSGFVSIQNAINGYVMGEQGARPSGEPPSSPSAKITCTDIFGSRTFKILPAKLFEAWLELCCAPSVSP